MNTSKLAIFFRFRNLRNAKCFISFFFIGGATKIWIPSYFGCFGSISVWLWHVDRRQTSATCPATHVTLTILHESFHGRVISLFSDQNWPAQSCDVIPMKVFCEVFLNFTLKPTSPRLPKHWSSKLNPELAKYQDIYAKPLLTISPPIPWLLFAYMLFRL